MRKYWLIAIAMLLCCSAVARNERDTLGVGTLVSFVENAGQWEHPARFEAQLHDAALFLEDDAITVALRQHTPHPDPARLAPRHHAYRMRFLGSAPPTLAGLHRQPSPNHYFLGNDPSRWRSHVAAYDAVRYDGLYPGIDLEVFGGSEALKYNLLVHPQADASQIALLYEGTDGVEVLGNGNLRIRTSVRDIVEMKPYVYQPDASGREQPVSSRWRVSRSKGGYRAVIELGPYDHSRLLVIDPVLVFSTYTGSAADNWGTTAAYDSKKNVYTAGLVFNIGYPTSVGAYQPDYGGNVDIGLFKFDSAGTSRLYATYLGGSLPDMPHSMFVNSFDELLIFGTTGSANFPVTAGAYSTSFSGGTSIDYFSQSIQFANGSDLFVCRFSSDGSQLQASTYVGGSGNDGLNYRHRYNSSLTTVMHGNDSLYYNYGDGARGEIITDNLNNVYIGTTTFSPDFPTTAGSVQPSHGGQQDGVVFKLDYNLRNLLWSTYLGGTGDDAVYSIDVDSAYNLLVCGGTVSPDFPVTAGAFQPSYGGGSADGFVSKIAYGGERLMASTFLGHRFYDQLYFVRTGHHNEVFVFGQSKNSGTSLIFNAGYSVVNGGMLLARLAPELDALRWSTVFGTSGRVNLSPTAFAVDICNRIYAAGWGRDFAGPYYGTEWYTAGTTGMETTADAYSSATDGQDFYIISLDDEANSLRYATFFGEQHVSGNSTGGGDHVDGGTSRFDRLATLYQSVCASCGGTQGFPVSPDAWSTSNNASNCNNAIFRYNVTHDFPVAEFLPPPAGCAPYTVGFSNTGRGTSFSWDFGDGSTSTERNPTHTYASSGLYTITLIASQPGGCATADTMRHTLHVLGNGTLPSLQGISCGNASIQIGPTPQIGATYQWLTEGVSDATVANPWVSASGTYLLRVSVAGCSEVDTFRVVNYTLIDSTSLTPVGCHDSADGVATFHLGPGINPDSITFSIAPPRNWYLTPNGTYVVGSLQPEVAYLVTAEGYGCLYEQELRLENPPVPPYEKEVVDILCTDSCAGRIHLRYNLSGSLADPPRDTLLEGLCEGSYTLMLTSDGCPLADTTVISRNRSLDRFSAWSDTERIYLGQRVGLHATEVDGASYLWRPAADLDRADAPSVVATPTDTLACYTVVAAVGGCSASDSLCIHCTDVACGTPDFIIPNAFTPNGDGVNDRLCFNADILTDFRIALYNRWGQCVYESSDATQCWDGTFRNAPCLAGVYTYTCHIRCHNGIETDLKGDITLIR